MKDQNASKMFTYVRGACSDGLHPETMKALGYMRIKHEGQIRKSGQPYIVHPLSLICLALGLYMNDDSLLAMLAYHDVIEDTNTLISELDTTNEIKMDVECMTFRKKPNETKLEAKRRYYENLIKRRNSAIGKALDRCDNLSTMEEDMTEKSIIKNVYETHYFLLPMLKEAKELWPVYANPLHVLRFMLKALNNTLAAAHGIELTDITPDDETLSKIFGD